MKQTEEPRYYSRAGGLITKEQWEDEQAAQFPAMARDLAAKRTRDFLAAAQVQITEERNQRGTPFIGFGDGADEQ